jgi:hypothetical protein
MARRSSSRTAAAFSAFFAVMRLAYAFVRARPLDATRQDAASQFHASHIHLTNDVQQGIDVKRFLAIMGDRAGRSTLFGYPLQQHWSYANSGDFAPTHYLQTDAPLYYYSFTDAYIASVYRSLTPTEQARFDPMITGFTPRTCTASTTSAASSAPFAAEAGPVVILHSDIDMPFARSTARRSTSRK